MFVLRHPLACHALTLPWGCLAALRLQHLPELLSLCCICADQHELLSPAMVHKPGMPSLLLCQHSSCAQLTLSMPSAFLWQLYYPLMVPWAGYQDPWVLQAGQEPEGAAGQGQAAAGQSFWAAARLGRSAAAGWPQQPHPLPQACQWPPGGYFPDCKGSNLASVHLYRICCMQRWLSCFQVLCSVCKGGKSAHLVGCCLAGLCLYCWFKSLQRADTACM